MAWRRFLKWSGGINPPSGRAAVALYAQIVSRVVPVSSTRAAEMAKLLENIFRCVNIALVNELKQLALRMGMDIWEVIDAAATKPFGFMPFYPGPGLGGHCIPVDPFYLSWKAREYDFATRFIELAGEVNTAMPYHVVEAIAAALKRPAESAQRLASPGARRRVQKRRGRPARIAHAEDHATAASSAARRSITTIPISRSCTRCGTMTIARMRSIDLTPANLGAYDCVVIATDHTSYDYRGDRGGGAARGGHAQRYAADRAQPEQDRSVLAAEAKERRHPQAPGELRVAIR